MLQAYLDMVEKNKLLEKQKALPAVEEERESQQHIDFFLCDENKPKKSKTKRIKALTKVIQT